MSKKWKLHHSLETKLIQHKKFKSRCRPSENQEAENLGWQISANCEVNQKAVEEVLAVKGCFVLGTNVSTHVIATAECMARYVEQGKVERGFRFLKSPSFFTSSL